MNKISLAEIKIALRDSKFRQSIPPEFKADVQKYEQNPGCPCNLPIYKTILKHCQKQIKEYYPNREIAELDDKLTENNFSVINCHVNDLENKLKELPSGRKQLAIGRYQDQITVIINELEY